MNLKLRILILAFLSFAFVSCSGGSDLPQFVNLQKGPPPNADATRSW